jgi:hypothetical protein
MKGSEATSIDSLEVAELGLVKQGLKVNHPFFGLGTVVALFSLPDGGNTIGVEFDSCGYKALVPQYAKLQLA